MRLKWPISAVCCLLVASSPLHAQDWLEVSTDRYTVVSQLNERTTLRWAREFDQFLQALRGLMPTNESLLPPLTVVLFERDGGFSPYRIRTDTGVVGGNSGVFINYSTWSVLGMPGVRGSSTDNSTIYHEAVHWHMSADPSRSPLWFSEGIAGVFQTFEAERGMARWGRTIPDSISFLLAVGLQPFEEFIEVSQSEALHANRTYYSQAWLFVHYLLVGRVMDGGPALLGDFLTNWQAMDPADAFHATFDMEFEEMDRVLRAYARQDRLNVSSSEIPETGNAEPVVRPASEALVELSLARLAFGTGNDDTLSRHLERLIEIAPDSAESYDLLVARKLRDGENDIEEILDQAIARGSRDARTYELKAAASTRIARANVPLFSSTAFQSGDARRIANLLVSSANLQLLNLRVYRQLVDVLFSVNETHEYDQVALENAAALFPQEGIILIGQAALALTADNPAEATRLIDLALAQYNLSDRETAAARSLRARLNR